MPFPARLLNPGEEVVADVRTHWWYFAGPVAAAVAVLAGAVAAVVIGAARPVDLAVVVVLGVALAWLVVRYVRWSGTHLFVTTDRLIHRQGLVARRGREIPLDHLSDIEYRQTIWQRVLGAGDLVLESAGRDSREVFPWLPHPGAIQNEIYRQIDASRTQRGVSVAEEIDRLDGLRRRGVLTEAEFEAQKARLLSRP
ncbi:PH domain-containing protein [Acidiferrimicrobium sp. IK]|uniref:PH domain-containing protein n=1 Tax=Acidiferrimicrobium sp. IK TaxID=2871700 RepID=UPI0021CB3031|nr:PH domain-containing protein [Acidiferrimicrobium sp. IK]MCU4183803.1 PH domain-containing protein [Acidiferrimicrobium sp. IK]